MKVDFTQMWIGSIFATGTAAGFSAYPFPTTVAELVKKSECNNVAPR
jgi:hypothetical protein